MFRALLLIVCLLTPSAAFAKGEGVDSRVDFPPAGGCGSAATGEELGCHFTDANPQLMVTIEGPTSVPVGLDTFASYTASIPVDFMNLLGAGINVVIDSANVPNCVLEELAPVGKIGTRAELLDPTDIMLSHIGNDAQPTNLEDVWSYDFLLRDCSAPGDLTLTVSMNAFNGDGTEEFEIWNFAQRSLSVPEPGAGWLAMSAAAALAAIARARSRA